MIPPSMIPLAMFPSTPLLVIGPLAVFGVLAVATLVVLLVAGTMAERRSMDLPGQTNGRPHAHPLDRAA